VAPSCRDQYRTVRVSSTNNADRGIHASSYGVEQYIDIERLRNDGEDGCASFALMRRDFVDNGLVGGEHHHLNG
jgi:hypothetical protein